MPRNAYAWMLCCSLAIAAATSIGCANSTTPEPVGGETHFLHACEGEGSCGLGLDCVCGVCTKPCVTDNSCKDESSLATCEASGTPNGACDNPQASPVCDVKCTLDSECKTLGATYTCESGSCRKLDAGSCVRDGVVYTDCSDGGIDGGMDAEVNPFPTDLACMGDDTDGGVPYPSRLVVREAPPLCAGADAVLQQTGVELVGNGRDLMVFEITPTDAYWFSWTDLDMVRAELGSSRSWIFDENQIDITALAIDGCQIVAGGRDHSDIISVQLDGSDPRTLAIGSTTGTAGPESILLDATHAYVAQWDSLMRVARTGGTLETLATRGSGVSQGPSMVMHNDRIIWIENPGPLLIPNAIVSVPKDGVGGGTPLASSLASPSALATDGTDLYVALGGSTDSLGNHNNDGSIARMPIDGGPLETLRVTGRIPISIAVDATQIYWLQSEVFNGGTPRNTLWKAPKGNLQNATMVADNAWTFRIDATHIYWNWSCIAGNTTEGFLVRAPKGQN